MIFLAEAFTRPKIMHRLAKLGFTQSYTYFTWRNSKAELHRVFHRADAIGFARILPAQRLAEHAGHPARNPCKSAAGPPSLRRLVLAGDACRELRNLRTGVRIAGTVPREAGSEEYLRFGKVRVAAMGPGTRRQPGATACTAQPHPPGAAGAAAGLAARFPADRQRSVAVLCQVDAGPVERRRHDRQSRLSPYAVGLGDARPGKPGHRRRQAVPDARPAERRALHVARCAQLRTARSGLLPAHIFVVRRQSRQEQNFDYYA